MKKAVAIIIFLSLLTQCVIQLGVWGYYQINKAYIAQNLCENRNKPQKNCCGKCYLRKQLKKVDENSTSKKAPVKTEKSETVEFVVTPVFTAPQHFIAFISSVHNPVGQHMYGHTVPFPIFHPPSVC